MSNCYVICAVIPEFAKVNTRGGSSANYKPLHEEASLPVRRRVSHGGAFLHFSHW
jgi:hypothetical protein